MLKQITVAILGLFEVILLKLATFEVFLVELYIIIIILGLLIVIGVSAEDVALPDFLMRFQQLNYAVTVI